MTTEQDGYVTVHPVVALTAERVEANIAEAVEGVVEAGNQPLCVRVDIESYKALLSRDGLERRSLRVWNADSLRARVHGFELPVDADIRVPADVAWVYTVNLPTGRA